MDDLGTYYTVRMRAQFVDEFIIIFIVIIIIRLTIHYCNHNYE